MSPGERGDGAWPGKFRGQEPVLSARLHLGSSPPWVPRRREGAAVRRRLELVSL